MVRSKSPAPDSSHIVVRKQQDVATHTLFPLTPLGKMKIPSKKMVFTAEKRGRRVCVLLIRKYYWMP
jgi:hypothetical protein